MQQIIGLIFGKRYAKMRQPMGLHHPVQDPLVFRCQEKVMSHMGMCIISYRNEFCHVQRIVPDIKMSHATYRNAFRHVQQVRSHKGTSHVTYTNDSCHIIWFQSHVKMSHVTYRNEFFHTQRVMTHILFHAAAAMAHVWTCNLRQFHTWIHHKTESCHAMPHSNTPFPCHC